MKFLTGFAQLTTWFTQHDFTPNEIEIIILCKDKHTGFRLTYTLEAQMNDVLGRIAPIAGPFPQTGTIMGYPFSIKEREGR